MTKKLTEEIEPVELLQRCRGGELWQLLDVREPWELENVQVQETANMPIKAIPMNEVPQRTRELDPSRPVAVLCHSGGRSAHVADFLAGKGFARVANVHGGIAAWPCDRLSRSGTGG
ncbi:MAG: rhodanese-like domain-containing protein [Woeseia sp.]